MKGYRFLVVPLCAALCAALCSHVAIDVAGDYLLPHDTFDDVAHGSRPLAGWGAVLLAMLVLGAAVRGAILEAAGHEAAFCRALRALAPRDGRVFFLAVLLPTWIALLAMQVLDNFAAGADADDLTSLLGGSILLGCACTLLSAILAACCARYALDRLASFRRKAVAIAVALLHRHARVPACSRVVREIGARFGLSALVPRHCCAGRAPPHLAFVR